MSEIGKAVDNEGENKSSHGRQRVNKCVVRRSKVGAVSFNSDSVACPDGVKIC